MVRGTMLVATPTHDELPRRFSDFATFGEAMDSAATGKRGLNFHDPRGNLTLPYPFSELREDSLRCAYRLVGFGVRPHDRIALVSEFGRVHDLSPVNNSHFV